MRKAGAVAIGGLALLAACGESPVATQPNDPSAPGPVAEQQDAPPIAVMRTRNDIPLAPEREGAHTGAGKAAGTSSGIIYHNGPILPTPKTAAIYWSATAIYAGAPASGSGTGADGSLIGFFMSNLGSSNYWGINNTYTNSSGGRVAKSLGFLGYWATGTTPPAKPTDANMQALLNQGFSTGKLVWDPQGIYAIFTGHGINLGGGFGTQYCAYHYWYTAPATAGAAAGKVVKYAAMPYNADFPSGCMGQTNGPNGDAAADGEMNTLAHELEEAATDPEGTAWYDRRGNENADKCAWNFGTTQTAANGTRWNILAGGKQFYVQQNWKNVAGGGCFLQ